MTYYFIRLTTDNTDKQQLSQLFPAPYLISQEYSKRQRLHYHIVHQSSLNKDQIKELVYSTFPDEPRGTSTLKIDIIGPSFADWERVSTYTVKDGDFIYSPEFEPYIETFVANSYRRDLTYTDALSTLIEEAIEPEYHRIDWLRLKINIAKLRARYGLEVYISKIEALVLSVHIRVNENIAEELFSR